MKPALSQRVKVMLTNPATHRYSNTWLSCTCSFFSFHYMCCQAGKHRKKSSARKTHGRKIEGSNKLSASTDLMASEVKWNYCCQIVRYVFAWIYVMVTISITCRDFLKVLMLLPVLFNCTVLKVGCSIIVNFSFCMHLYIQCLVSHFLKCITDTYYWALSLCLLW